MIRNRTFVEMLALATAVFCIWIPAALFAWFSFTAKKFIELPTSWSVFMGAANTITLGILGLQQFASRTKTTTTTPTATTTTVTPNPSP